MKYEEAMERKESRLDHYREIEQDIVLLYRCHRSDCPGAKAFTVSLHIEELRGNGCHWVCSECNDFQVAALEEEA